MFDEFFKEMLRHVPEDARIMGCQFRGDPNSDIYGKWRARTLRRASMVDELANVYLCVSAMKQNSRGEWRRRKENFAGGLLLMIDDVGDGKGSKFPLSTLSALTPTALVETSAGNFQATYFFDTLIEDIELFDALIRSFIERQFLGNDTGQAGVNRVFRPPAGINGKPRHELDGQPWKVALSEWRPELRYSVQQIAEAFDLKLQKRNPMQLHAGTVNNLKAERIRTFMSVRAAMRSAGMIKREEPDYSGWIQIACPWVDQHTDGVDNGAAIREPADENGWYGGFRCHHGHCAEKGWRELTDWLSHHVQEILDQVNKHAPDWRDLKME